MNFRREFQINNNHSTLCAYAYIFLSAFFVLCLSACNSGSNPSPAGLVGSLSIAPLLESTGIESNGTTYALVSRSGSLENALIIAVVSSDSSTMSVESSACSLNASESSCYIALTGESVGSAILTATADSYTESKVTFTVTPAPLFSCVADISGATPTLCGCLNQNDGSGLTWYAAGTQAESWTNWCTKAQDPGGACTENGTSINSFNAVGHCGYSDWHLPTAPDASNANWVNQMGGNWESIGNYAINSGSYRLGDYLNDWLNANNFSGVTDNIYWSSASYPGGYAWVVSMTSGYALATSVNIGFHGGVILVRGGQ